MKGKEVLAIVEELNNNLAGEGPDFKNNPQGLEFEFKSNGWCYIVEFNGFRLWDSENDEREYDESPEVNDYEPLKPYLITRLNILVGEMSRLGTYLMNKNIEERLKDENN